MVVAVVVVVVAAVVVGVVIGVVVVLLVDFGSGWICLCNCGGCYSCIPAAGFCYWVDDWYCAVNIIPDVLSICLWYATPPFHSMSHEFAVWDVVCMQGGTVASAAGTVLLSTSQHTMLLDPVGYSAVVRVT